MLLLCQHISAGLHVSATGASASRRFTTPCAGLASSTSTPVAHSRSPSCRLRPVHTRRSPRFSMMRAGRDASCCSVRRCTRSCMWPMHDALSSLCQRRSRCRRWLTSAACHSSGIRLEKLLFGIDHDGGHLWPAASPVLWPKWQWAPAGYHTPAHTDEKWELRVIDTTNWQASISSTEPGRFTLGLVCLNEWVVRSIFVCSKILI